MAANEDPTPPFTGGAPDPAPPSEDLEHWLRDLRTEVVANPSDWADTTGDHPVAEPPTRIEPPARAEGTRGGGRHRASD
jgi:hypothetical protein